MKRKEVYSLLVEEQKQTISALENAMNLLDSDVDIDESGTLDPDDYSHQSESKDMYLRTKVQLDQAISDLESLKNLANHVSSKIEQGAVIETEDAIFFFGTATTTVLLDGKQILGVSPEAPAFNELIGKQTGDHFVLGNKEYKILSIF